MEVYGHSRLLGHNNVFCDSLWSVDHFLKKIPLDMEWEFLFWCEQTKISKDMFQLANENREM